MLRTRSRSRRSATASSLALLLVLFVTAGPACNGDENPVGPTGTIVGSGVLAQQARVVSGFSRLNMSAVGTVRVTVGATEGLVIEAEDNFLEHIVTEVQDGVLEISLAPNISLQTTRPIQFLLTVVTLTNATLSGVGSIEATGLDVDRLDLTMSGVGDIVMAGLAARELVVTLTGVGGLVCSGTVTVQRVTHSGVGDYRGQDLQSSEADVRTTSIGSATVRVRDKLTATVSGTGSIFYIGSPAVTSTITGTGSVVQIGT
jgi:hypothetical protein